MKNALGSAALLLLLGACGDDFVPGSYLNDLRILAISADPVEVGPGQDVTLQPTVFVPEGRSLSSLSWKFCPLSLGAQAGYQCLAPSCEVALQPGSDGTVTANPSLLALQCAQELRAQGEAAPSGAPKSLPDSVETVFTLNVADDSGNAREAVMRVKLWTRETPARNRAPRILQLDADGAVLVAGAPATRTAAPGAKLRLTVRVDEQSLDEYVDADGSQRREDPVVSFFATAGRLQGESVSGVEATVEWELTDLRPGEREALIWLVVRDLRGGQGIAGPFAVGIAGR